MSHHAVDTLRSAIQATRVRDARIGKPADLEAALWIGKLLGFTWPRSYLAILGKHDGFFLGRCTVFSLAQSLEVMLMFRETFRRRGHWPVGGDGCGSYFVLAVHELHARECPVYFADGNDDWIARAPGHPTYADFVIHACRPDSAV